MVAYGDTAGDAVRRYFGIPAESLGWIELVDVRDGGVMRIRWHGEGYVTRVVYLELIE